MPHSVFVAETGEEEDESDALGDVTECDDFVLGENAAKKVLASAWQTKRAEISQEKLRRRRSMGKSDKNKIKPNNLKIMNRNGETRRTDKAKSMLHRGPLGKRVHSKTTSFFKSEQFQSPRGN